MMTHQQQQQRRVAMNGQHQAAAQIDIYEDPLSDGEMHPHEQQQQQQQDRQRQRQSSHAVETRRRTAHREPVPPGAPIAQEKKRQLAPQDVAATGSFKKKREASASSSSSSSGVAGTAMPVAAPEQRPSRHASRHHQKHQSSTASSTTPAPAEPVDKCVNILDNPPRPSVIRYRNGKVVEQMEVVVHHRDGKKSILDGRVFLPEGEVVHPDGTIIRTTATIDGKVFHEVSIPVKPQEPTQGQPDQQQQQQQQQHKKYHRYIVEQGMRRKFSSEAYYLKLTEQIEYGQYYEDDVYQYRHVILPKQLLYRAHRRFFEPKEPYLLRLLSEQEWRTLGLTMSHGWENYMRHDPEPHVMLFRRRKDLLQQADAVAPGQAQGGGVPQGQQQHHLTGTSVVGGQTGTTTQGAPTSSTHPNYPDEAPSPIPTQRAFTPPMHSRSGH